MSLTSIPSGLGANMLTPSLSSLSGNAGLAGTAGLTGFAGTAGTAGTAGLTGSNNPLTSNQATSSNPYGALGGSSAIGDGSLGSIVQAIVGILTTLLSTLMGQPGAGANSSLNADSSNGSSGTPGAYSTGSGGCQGGGCSGNAGGAAPTGDTAGSPSDPTGGAGGSSGGGDAQFLQMINAERAKNGLKPVKYSDALNKSSANNTQMMGQDGSLSHNAGGTDFTSRDKQAGYNGSPKGECVAEGQSSAAEAFQAWMSDKPHRDIMMDPNITEIGLGHSGSYWSLDTGS